MATKITATTIEAEVSSIRPRMSVAVMSSPIANVTQLVPVASLSYIEMSVGSVSLPVPVATMAPSATPAASLTYAEPTFGTVEADTTGRYRYVAEMALIVDSVAKATDKPLLDGVTTVDQARKTSAQSLSDQAVLLDAKRWVLANLLRDALAATDQRNSLVSKLLGDLLAGITDARSLTPGKTLASTTMVDDGERRATTDKALADSFALADALVSLLTYNRAFSDSIGLADSHSNLFALGERVDAVGAADIANLFISKALSDAFGVEDGTAVGDGSTYSFEKGVNNLVVLAEFFTALHTKSQSEALSTADAGLVSMQSYCDITYFAEDYIGFSQTF
jgi:hypothetical protein